MRLEHPIFHGPLHVDLDLGEVDTPEDYRHWPDGRDLPPKLKSWKVQAHHYPDVDPGVVSDPYGFEDSPDAEWISSGVNSKGPNSLALGRQANLFLWGFSGSPSEMTESGRRVFVNAIVYMKGFDGARPQVFVRAGGSLPWARDWALVFAGYARRLADADKAGRAMIEEHFPPSVRAACGLDADKLEAYYRENLEYLRPFPDGFEVDEPCKALGVGNRDARFIPTLLDRWRANPSDPRYPELAKRYLDAAPSLEPSSLAAWYETNKDRLFFSDRAGFRWLVNGAAVWTGAANR